MAGNTISSVGRGLCTISSGIPSITAANNSSPLLAFKASPKVVWVLFFGVTKKTDLPNSDDSDDLRLTKNIDPYNINVCNRYHVILKGLIVRR